jgi:hypothetical protein
VNRPNAHSPNRRDPAHNPEVAGSNPAPLLERARKRGSFGFRRGNERQDLHPFCTRFTFESVRFRCLRRATSVANAPRRRESHSNSVRSPSANTRRASHRQAAQRRDRAGPGSRIGAGEERRAHSLTPTVHRVCGRAIESGSDGARTRDLRRDRPSRAQPHAAANSSEPPRLQVLLARGARPPAWLSQSSNRPSPTTRRRSHLPLT